MIVKIERNLWDEIITVYNNLPKPHNQKMIKTSDSVKAGLCEVEFHKKYVEVEVRVVQDMEYLFTWSLDNKLSQSQLSAAVAREDVRNRIKTILKYA